MKKRSRLKKLCALVAVIAVLVFAGSALADTYTVPTYSSYFQTTAAVNVRSGPSLKYPIIGTVSQGQVVQGLGSSGGWTQIVVSPANTTAYVSSSYLSSYIYMDATSRVVYPSCTVPVYNYNNYHSTPYTQGELFYYQNPWNNCYGYNYNYNYYGYYYPSTCYNTCGGCCR